MFLKPVCFDLRCVIASQHLDLIYQIAVVVPLVDKCAAAVIVLESSVAWVAELFVQVAFLLHDYQNRRELQSTALRNAPFLELLEGC